MTLLVSQLKLTKVLWKTGDDHHIDMLLICELVLQLLIANFSWLKNAQNIQTNFLLFFALSFAVIFSRINHN